MSGLLAMRCISSCSRFEALPRAEAPERRALREPPKAAPLPPEEPKEELIPWRPLGSSSMLSARRYGALTPTLTASRAEPRVRSRPGAACCLMQ